MACPFAFLHNPWDGYPPDRRSGWYLLWFGEGEAREERVRYYNASYDLWFFGAGFSKTPDRLAYEEGWQLVGPCRAPQGAAEFLEALRPKYPLL